MTKGYDLEHTDATQQARFKSLAPDEQMMEIWLNTRETNGHVASALRDTHDLKDFRDNELKPWMTTVDRRFLIATTMGSLAMLLVPIVLTLMGYIEWK